MSHLPDTVGSDISVNKKLVKAAAVAYVLHKKELNCPEYEEYLHDAKLIGVLTENELIKTMLLLIYELHTNNYDLATIQTPALSDVISALFTAMNEHLSEKDMINNDKKDKKAFSSDFSKNLIGNDKNNDSNDSDKKESSNGSKDDTEEKRDVIDIDEILGCSKKDKDRVLALRNLIHSQYYNDIGVLNDKISNDSIVFDYQVILNFMHLNNDMCDKILNLEGNGDSQRKQINAFISGFTYFYNGSFIKAAISDFKLDYDIKYVRMIAGLDECTDEITQLYHGLRGGDGAKAAIKKNIIETYNDMAKHPNNLSELALSKLQAYLRPKEYNSHNKETQKHLIYETDVIDEFVQSRGMLDTSNRNTEEAKEVRKQYYEYHSRKVTRSVIPGRYDSKTVENFMNSNHFTKTHDAVTRWFQLRSQLSQSELKEFVLSQFEKFLENEQKRDFDKIAQNFDNKADQGLKKAILKNLGPIGYNIQPAPKTEESTQEFIAGIKAKRKLAREQNKESKRAPMKYITKEQNIIYHNKEDATAFALSEGFASVEEYKEYERKQFSFSIVHSNNLTKDVNSNRDNGSQNGSNNGSGNTYGSHNGNNRTG